jgi:hypothetical protein
MCVGFFICPLICAAILWRLCGGDLRRQRPSDRVTPVHLDHSGVPTPG